MRKTAFPFLFVVLGCDQKSPVEISQLAEFSLVQESVPPRGTGISNRHWTLFSDSVAWQYAAASDTVFTVGLKLPGTTRGTYRGHPYIALPQWANYATMLASSAGVALVKIDSLLPQARVLVKSPVALAVIRRLPFVDFVEPTLLRLDLADSGCEYDPFLNPSSYTASGDILPQHFPGMRIPAAWGISKWPWRMDRPHRHWRRRRWPAAIRSSICSWKQRGPLFRADEHDWRCRRRLM